VRNQHKTKRSRGKSADNELIELSESDECEQIGLSYREISMPPVKKPAAKKSAAPAKKAAAPVKKAATVAVPTKKSAAAPAKKAAAKKAAAPQKKAAVKAAPQVTITLKQIAASLAEGHDLPKKQAETLLGDLVALTTNHLRKGDKIRLTGLGILQVRNRAARTGRNPATGEAIEIKASKKIAFRPAKELKDSV
jgi:DNA-binding protein HU-beta